MSSFPVGDPGPNVPVVLPLTGQTIYSNEAVSGLLTAEIALWILRGLVPRGSGIHIPRLAQAASVTPDITQGQAQLLTITANTNITLNAPTGATEGSLFQLIILNSSGGAYSATLTLSGLGGTVQVPGNGGTAYFEWIFDGTNWTQLTVPSAGGAAPTGPAGGDLGGTYPNPTALKTGGVPFGTAAVTDATAYDAAGAAAAAQAAAIAASWPAHTVAANSLLGNNTGSTAVPIALTAAQVQTLLGLVIGTNVEAWSAVLDALATVMSATATAAAQRTALGLGTAATQASSAFDAAGAAAAAQAASDPAGSAASAQAAAIASSCQRASNLSDVSNAGTARTNLGLAIGTNVASQTDVRFTQIASSQQSGAYTFTPTDAGTCVESTDASANTFTIDTHANQAIPVNSVIEVFQDGAGQVTIAAAGGVTLRSDGGKVKTAAQYATIRLRQRATDEWVLAGDLA